MKNKLFIILGQTGQNGTKRDNRPDLSRNMPSIIVRRDKAGQGGTNTDFCPASRDKAGRDNIIYPLFKGGIKCLVPLSRYWVPSIGTKSL